VKEGVLDTEKYESEMTFLFRCIEKVIRDNKDTAFEGKGFKRILLSKFGQGFFLTALSPKEKHKANLIFKSCLGNFLNSIEALGLDIKGSAFSEKDLQGDDTWKTEGISGTVVGDIIETAKEFDLVINSWDPNSAPGNGNDGDRSFDGAIGKATGVLLTQTAWFNEALRKPESMIGV
jgi:hypothetical protein